MDENLLKSSIICVFSLGFLLQFGCSHSKKILDSDDSLRHKMVTECPENPDECFTAYDAIEFKTRKDARTFLKSLYLAGDTAEFRKVFHEIILTDPLFIYPDHFEYVEEGSTAFSAEIFTEMQAHNEAYISTLINQHDVRFLLKMANEDQEIRKQLIEEIDKNGMTSKFMELNFEMGRIDSTHLQELRKLTSWDRIHSTDIIGQIGNVGIKSIFYIVQHSGDHKAMKHMLECKYLESYDRFRLIDRLRIEKGKKQLYGTQFDRNGEMEPIKSIKWANKMRMENGIRTIATVEQN